MTTKSKSKKPAAANAKANGSKRRSWYADAHAEGDAAAKAKANGEHESTNTPRSLAIDQFVDLVQVLRNEFEFRDWDVERLAIAANDRYDSRYAQHTIADLKDADNVGLSKSRIERLKSDIAEEEAKIAKLEARS